YYKIIKMKEFKYIGIFLLTVILFSCTKEDRLDHIDADAPAPAQVTDIKEFATPGGVKLTYKIPADKNLSYIKAIYEIRPGVYREAKSSIYTDTLSLVGFGDSESHNVQLISVGKNEKVSEPVSVTVTPATPPV